MDHPLNAPALLRQYGLRPKKSLGQNFLVDPAALQRVVNAGGVGEGDSVLEIGAGLGSLTRLLAAQSGRVVAVEIDERLIPPLRQVLTPFENVTIIQADILDLDPADLFDSPYLVIANIPYYITSAIIRRLLESERPPSRLVLTVQREVARRICAEGGGMSLLALSVQVYGKPSVAARIPAAAFYPAPKVDSAVVRVDLYPQPRIPAEGLDTFFRLAKAGFRQRRKMLRNALPAGMGWPKARADALLLAAGIDPQRRAETLNLEEWGALVIRTNML
ncbi:MAG: 16S rRNA (adenine(1518)-N(6)/adenine(1519)-N(6))-dimethyltransferase RsmA [Anaerolineales bacterium]